MDRKKNLSRNRSFVGFGLIFDSKNITHNCALLFIKGITYTNDLVLFFTFA